MIGRTRVGPDCSAGLVEPTELLLGVIGVFDCSTVRVLGDIVALGPDPVGVLEILAELPDVSFISGNTERYVLTGDRPYPSFEDVAIDPRLIPQLVEVATSFAWTRGMLTHAGWLPWFASLPSELRWTLPDKTRLLGIPKVLRRPSDRVNPAANAGNPPEFRRIRRMLWLGITAQANFARLEILNVFFDPFLWSPVLG